MEGFSGRKLGNYAVRCGLSAAARHSDEGARASRTRPMLDEHHRRR